MVAAIYYSPQLEVKRHSAFWLCAVPFSCGMLLSRHTMIGLAVLGATSAEGEGTSRVSVHKPGLHTNLKLDGSLWRTQGKHGRVAAVPRTSVKGLFSEPRRGDDSCGRVRRSFFRPRGAPRCHFPVENPYCLAFLKARQYGVHIGLATSTILACALLGGRACAGQSRSSLSVVRAL